MALAPSRQFYLLTFFDSFQSSFSKFHGTHFLFFRHGSSVTSRKHTLCATKYTNYSSTPDQNPGRKSKFSSKPQTSTQYKSKRLSSSSWIDKWNGPHQQVQPKPPRAVLTYSSEGNNLSSSCFNSSDCNRGSNGGGGGSTMERIVEKLKKFGYVDNVKENKEERLERVIEKESMEDIFYVEEGMLPNSRGRFSAGHSWG